MAASDRRLTDSGIEVKPVYTADDVAGLALEPPGEYPFTRGPYADMYRGRPWTIRQYAGFGSAEETNERFRFLLAQGQTGLSVAFDLPTQLGYDSDHPRAAGEVGRAGRRDRFARRHGARVRGDPARPCLHVDDDQRAGGAPAPALRAGSRAAGSRGRAAPRHRPERRPEGVRGARATTSSRRGPRCGSPPISSPTAASGCRAGTRSRSPATTSARLARPRCRSSRFTLANGIAYCEAAVAAGLSPDEFGERLSFFFNAHNHFFQEVAKFRAARRLWARIMKERFGVTNPKAQALRFHAQTGGSTLTAQQPENNIVRVAIQALSAICGGAQSLHTNSFDEALALPTEHAARIALRTQQILLHEAGTTDTADPLGGSYFIEALTRRARGAGLGVDRANRRARRRGGGHRAGLHPERDRRVGVRLRPPGRGWRARHRGSEPVRGRRGDCGADPPARPVDRAASGGADTPRPHRARRPRSGGRARSGPRDGSRRRKSPRADAGGACHPLHGRRGLRRATRGLRDVRRSGRAR